VSVTDRLADIEVLDPDEGTHRLGDAWAQQALVLVFIRHFG